MANERAGLERARVTVNPLKGTSSFSSSDVVACERWGGGCWRCAFFLAVKNKPRVHALCFGKGVVIVVIVAVVVV